MQRASSVSKGTIDTSGQQPTETTKPSALVDKLEHLKQAGKDSMAAGAPADARILSTIDSSKALLYQVGNASHALTAEAKDLAQKVLDMIHQSFFVALDEFHQADKRDVVAAEAAVHACNAAATVRRASSGDVGRLGSRTMTLQTNHTKLSTKIAEKTAAELKANKALVEFVKAIPAPKPCSLCEGMPQGSDNIDQWKGYFQKPDWFHQQKTLFESKLAEHEGAKMALTVASQEVDTNKAVLKEVFCTWKVELEGTCEALRACHKNTTTNFNATTRRVRSAVATRLKAHKAGQAVLSHVKFLLGHAGYAENTTFENTSRYELEIPMMPEMSLCDLSELNREEWGHASPCLEMKSGPEPYTGPAVYSKFVTHVENGVCKEPGFVAITDQAECRQAAVDLGARYSEGKWPTNHNGPCFAEGDNKRLYWNNAEGQLSDHGCPVCKKKFLG